MVQRRGVDAAVEAVVEELHKRSNRVKVNGEKVPPRLLDCLLPLRR